MHILLKLHLPRSPCAPCTLQTVTRCTHTFDWILANVIWIAHVDDCRMADVSLAVNQHLIEDICILYRNQLFRRSMSQLQWSAENTRSAVREEDLRSAFLLQHNARPTPTNGLLHPLGHTLGLLATPEVHHTRLRKRDHHALRPRHQGSTGSFIGIKFEEAHASCAANLLGSHSAWPQQSIRVRGEILTAILHDARQTSRDSREPSEHELIWRKATLAEMVVTDGTDDCSHLVHVIIHSQVALVVDFDKQLLEEIDGPLDSRLEMRRLCRDHAQKSTRALNSVRKLTRQMRLQGIHMKMIRRPSPVQPSNGVGCLRAICTDGPLATHWHHDSER